MAYLDYETYQEYGGTLDETTFNDLAFQAEVQIDWYTFNRLQDDSEVSERVKRCMYALIKLIQDKLIASAIPSDTGDTLNNVQAGITGQSNDGVSISYNVLSASEIVKNSQDEIRRCVEIGLQGVKNQSGKKVTWRGIYPNE